MTKPVDHRQTENVVIDTAPEARGLFAQAHSYTAGFARLAIFLALTLVLATAISAHQPAASDDASHASAIRPWSGSAQPAFTLKDTDGNVLSLADYRGQPLLVHFFATWCEPCRPEMESLERLARRADTSLRIISISVNEPASRVRKFFGNMPVSFPVLLDPDRDTAKAWGVDILPTSYLLDADLVPRLYVERDLEWDRLDISAILNALAAQQKRSSTNDRQQTLMTIQKTGRT